MQSFLFQKPNVLGALRSPVFVGVATLAKRATERATLENVIAVCDSLQDDEFTRTMSEAYRTGLATFGDAWADADITSVLYAIAELSKPENYLEIGVRRGRSACMVGAASKKTSIFAFYLLQENYAHAANPGVHLVFAELEKVGHVGKRVIIEGDSHVTVPMFLTQHPDLTFDLITVDGDHSLKGAWDDLCTTVERLRVGGVIVFDDIDNPYCPGLMEVWNRFFWLSFLSSAATP